MPIPIVPPADAGSPAPDPNDEGKIPRTSLGKTPRSPNGKALRHEGAGAPPCECCCADVYCDKCRLESNWLDANGNPVNAHRTLMVKGVGITETYACSFCHNAYLTEPFWASGPRRHTHLPGLFGAPECQWRRYEVVLLGYKNTDCTGVEVVWPVLFESRVGVAGTPPDDTYVAFSSRTVVSDIGFWSIFHPQLGSSAKYRIPKGACTNRSIPWLVDEYGDPCATSTYNESWRSVAYDGRVEITPCYPCLTCADIHAALPSTVALSVLMYFALGVVNGMPEGSSGYATIAGGSTTLTKLAGRCKYEGRFDWIDFAGATWTGIAVLEYWTGGVGIVGGVPLAPPYWRLMVYKYASGYDSSAGYDSSYASNNWLNVYYRECDPSPLGGMFSTDAGGPKGDFAWIS